MRALVSAIMTYFSGNFMKFHHSPLSLRSLGTTWSAADVACGGANGMSSGPLGMVMLCDSEGGGVQGGRSAFFPYCFLRFLNKLYGSQLPPSSWTPWTLKNPMLIICRHLPGNSASWWPFWDGQWWVLVTIFKDESSDLQLLGGSSQLASG